MARLSADSPNDPLRLHFLNSWLERQRHVVILDDERTHREIIENYLLAKTGVKAGIAELSTSKLPRLVTTIPRTTRSLFEFLDLVLPLRLRNEELSDGREVINRLLVEGASSWKIYTKTFATCGWCLLNAVGYVIATLLGRNRTKS